MSHPPIGTITIVSSWRVKDARTGRWRTLRWKMDEEMALQWAAREGVEIEKLPGTDERRVSSGPHT